MGRRTTHVLFDFDGTLADSTPAILESYRHAFTEVLGYEYPVTQAEIDEMLSIRFLELCALKGGDRADELVTRFRERYLGELENPPAVYDGVHEMFEGLAARGITVGVVTNKTRVGAEHEIRRCGLGDVPFVCVVTADEATEGKPHPMPVLLGLEGAACAAEATYYVGDGGHDMEAARGAGVLGIGAAYGDWGAERLRAAGAHAVIERPLELLDVLDAELSSP